MIDDGDGPTEGEDLPMQDRLCEEQEAQQVGYRRPPREHRIKKGEKRNPWGRLGKPKPNRDYLEELVEGIINGRKRKITRSQALDEMLFGEASRGSVAAAKYLDRRAEKRRAAMAQGSADEVPSAEENEMLEHHLEKEVAKRLKLRDGQ
jgi:hypothetical protein